MTSPRLPRLRSTLICLYAAALGAVVLAVTIGAMPIGLADIAHTLANGRQHDPTSIVLWDARLPRVILAVSVGIALPAATVVMQLVLVNPIAEPALLGLGSAGALGASLAMSLGMGFASASSFAASFVVTLAAFLTLLVGRHSTMRAMPERMILQGIAIGALLGGFTGAVTSSLDNPQLRSLSTWTMGSLALATLPQALAAAAIIGTATLVLMALASRLDRLHLGSTYALARGIKVRHLRLAGMGIAAALVAGATAACGVIPFVGLAAVSAARRIVGITTLPLIASASAFGIILMTVGDTVARTALSPMELPVGLVTSIIGAPVLFAAVRSRG